MKKLLLFILGIIIIETVSGLTTELCEQEYANVATTCGGKANGTYTVNLDFGWGWSDDYAKLYDGNYSTGAYSTNAVNKILYINYTKPFNVNNKSIWSVNGSSGRINISNFSLTGNVNSCWERNSNVLELFVWLVAGNTLNYMCKNDTGNITIRADATSPYELMEEAMIWNITKTIQISFTNSITPVCTVTNGSISSSYVYSTGEGDSDTIVCELEGYNTLIGYLNISLGDQELTMTKKTLNLYFNLYNGTRKTTSGYWTDENRTQNFTTNNLTLNITDLAKGKVKIYFGNRTPDIMNYSQFYEFENDWNNNITENLTLLINETKYKTYIKVRDESGSPINGALVRLAYSNPYTGGTYYEMGQRYTGEEGTNGITYFWIDPYSDISIRVTKDGYTAQTKIININNEQYTYTSPLPITLTRGENLVQSMTSFIICQYYNNLSTTIPIKIYAPSKDNIEFNTSYNANLYDIPLDVFKWGSYTMAKGTHYCANCQDDLLVYIYSDDVLIGTYKVNYKWVVDVIDTPTGTDSDTITKFAWVFLILASGIIGLILGKGEGDIGSGDIGKGVFLAGCLVIPIILCDDTLMLFLYPFFN